MGSVNVNRNVSDAFYRYKMPRLLAKVEGKGNGIKTVIVNMVEIAKALSRPPTYPTKYFGCELGAQTQFDFKNDRFIVNGSHDAVKLQDLLDGFIKKFVLCPECENPETSLRVQHKKVVIQVCKACGYNGPLDGRHKLITFILKNPPDQNPAAQGSSLTEGKRSKRGKKQNGEVNGDGQSGTRDDNSDNEMAGGDEGDDDDDWAVDVSEEAVRARMQDLSDGVKSLAVTDDLEKTEKERVDLFYEFVKTKKVEGKLDGADKEILSMADRLEIKHKAPVILAELLFDQHILSQVKIHRILLLRFTHENPKAQKYLLKGIEQTISLHKDVLLSKVSHILKMFYDADIIEEEVILEWGKKVNKKYVSKEMSAEIHAKAEPFLKWLQEAEEEESSEGENDSNEDEENDMEMEYNGRANTSFGKEQAKGASAHKNEGEDDIDIDAI